jgi:putative phosphoserine phosphatase / 1-acylglycerol-3-phosphate O-acyltransferase
MSEIDELITEIERRDKFWPTVWLREPVYAGARGWIGTLAAVAAVNVGAALGLVAGRVHGDRRLAVSACAAGLQTALALAGVRLRVIGEHNLWAARPAVFVMNHQSGLDAMVLGALVRHDFTAAGKKETKYDPRTALIGRALDIVFLDRSNAARDRQEMGKLVERLRHGTSVLVAPEGTRTPTPVLAPFKKGAFHVALQAKVPVVPVVLRNTGELMPRGATMIRPGTVDVCVLDPIPTDDWTVDDLGERVAALHRRFAETLDHWPAPVTT